MTTSFLHESSWRGGAARAKGPRQLAAGARGCLRPNAALRGAFEVGASQASSYHAMPEVLRA